MSLNLEMVLRVTTNLKLNLINTAGESLIKESDLKKPEVHFILMEAIAEEFKIGFPYFQSNRSKDDQF